MGEKVGEMSTSSLVVTTDCGTEAADVALNRGERVDDDKSTSMGDAVVVRISGSD